MNLEELVRQWSDPVTVKARYVAGYDLMLAFMMRHAACFNGQGAVEHVDATYAGAICVECRVALVAELFADDTWDRHCRLRERIAGLRLEGNDASADLLFADEAARIRALVLAAEFGRGR
jgi:hypothetical protein